MKFSFQCMFILVGLALLAPASAHHSFAVFDFNTQIPFDGTVESLKFKDPHIEMTLNTIDEMGEKITIEFVEGASANMLRHNGLTVEMIKPGTHIKAYGSPLIADHTKYFLRKMVLDNGKEF